MSPAEMQLRRDKGVCYTCDEKFSWQHKCPNRHIMILQSDDEFQYEPTPEPPNTANSEVDINHHLSFNALKGVTGRKTIKFTRKIKGLFQILVDSGSSDNFLRPQIASCLKLDIKPTPQFQVLVSNGNFMKSQGFVRNLNALVQGHNLNVPARDVNFTRPHEYPRVIPATRRVWREDFSPADNGDGEFKYPFIKRGGGGDHWPRTRGYPM